MGRRGDGGLTREEARRLWALAGGDRSMFDCVWPVLATKLARAGWAPAGGFTRVGRCKDCGIRAGAGYLTPGVDAHGRCPSCATFYRRYGPPAGDEGDAALARPA